MEYAGIYRKHWRLYRNIPFFEIHQFCIMMKENDKLDKQTNRRIAQLPKQIQTKLSPLIEGIYGEFDKPKCFVEYTDPVSRDTILALKLLTLNESRVLVVTHDDSRTQFLAGLCHELDPASCNVLQVGKFNSINIDRKEAPIRNTIIGELDRVLYLMEKLYIRTFLLTHVIIDDLQLLLDQYLIAKVKRLVLCLPADCHKVYFYSTKPDDKNVTYPKRKLTVSLIWPQGVIILLQMELVKDPPFRPNASEKAVQRFVNGCIGFRPGQQNPQATFYSQKLYDYAKKIVDDDPMASTQHERFHYTKGHLKQTPKSQSGWTDANMPTQTNFLKTNKLNCLMRTPRISNDDAQRLRRRDSFNSAYQLNKMNQSEMKKSDWQANEYRFLCADRKQEYSALDDYNHDMFNSRAYKHEYRSHKPERPVCDKSFDLNRKPNQLQVIRVSMLENPNYVNKQKYKFPAEPAKKLVVNKNNLKGRLQLDNWKQFYHKDGHLIEQPRISILLQDKAARQEHQEQDRLLLMNRPLKSDAIERQRDLSQSQPPKSRTRTTRASSTRFFNYPRGVYDILYPRSILHK